MYTNETGTTISYAIISTGSRDSRITVASVVRDYDSRPAESDKFLRDKNNFVNRGSATAAGAYKDKERPHPRLLFLTGSVEVLEVRVMSDQHVQDNEKQSTDKILIKSL